METEIKLTAADFRVGQRVQEKEGRVLIITEIEDSVEGIDRRPTVSARKPNGVTCIQFFLDEIKPILRRYTDQYNTDNFTEKEELEYSDLLSSSYEDTIESVLWLIENGFDVWGWIDLGLAVDAATLNA